MENSDFEKNAQQSMSTFAELVDTFKKGLVFDSEGAVAGFKTISSEANKIDFGLLNSALEKVDFRFSALGIIATEVLTNITDMVMDAGTKIAKFLTVDSIAEGWKEYNNQIDSTLAIMTNTKFAHPMEEVNEVLDEMNTYSDKTIYNFTQMVQAMGTFTAGGLGLHQSKDAIIGLSNFAAAVGSTRDQYNRVMMQASAAMATGYMNLQHWRSFERAGGIGGTLLREKFLEEAIRLGKLGDKSLLDGLTEEEMLEKFRFSLKEGWLDREVMTNVFTEFANDPQMMAAATKVRTFGMMMEQIVESMGSGWARALRNLVGDLEEATERWTDLTLHISERTDAIADAIGDLFGKIAKAGGTDAFFNLMKNASTVLFNFLDVIWRSFTTVFPVFSDANIGKMVGFVNRLAESFEKLAGPNSGLMRFGQLMTSSFAWSMDSVGVLFSEFNTILVYLIRQVFPNFESGVKSISDAILWMMEHIQKFAFNFNKHIRALDISDTVISFIEDTKPLLKVFFEGFLPKMEEYANNFATAVVGAFIYLKDNMKDILQSISESKAGDLFRSWLAVWTAIAKAFKIIYGEIKFVFDALFKNMFPEANGVLEVIVGGLIWVVEKLTKVFNDLSESITKADSGVFKTLRIIGKDIKTVFAAITEDVGESKENPFRWLVDSIIWLYDQVTYNFNKFNNWLEGKNLGQRIVDFFTGGFSTATSNEMMVPSEKGIPEFLKRILGITTIQATGLLTGGAGSFRGEVKPSFFATLLSDMLSDTFGGTRKDREPYLVVSDAEEQIKSLGKTVAKVIGGGVLGTFNLLNTSLQKLPGIFEKGKEVFKPYGTAAKDLGLVLIDTIKKVLKVLLPSADDAKLAVGKATESISNMAKTLWDTATYIAEPAVKAIDDAFAKLWQTIKKKGEPVKDFLIKIKDSIVNFWNALGFMGKLIIALLVIYSTVRQVNKGLKIIGTSIEEFGRHISGMFEPFKNVLKSVSKAFYSISDMFKALTTTIKKMGNSIVILNFAIALGILAGSLWLIAKIPKEDLLLATISIVGLILGLVAVSMVLSELKFSKSGQALAGFSAAVVGITAAIVILAYIPKPTFNEAIDKLWTIAAILTVAMFVLSIPKGDFKASGAAILAFGVAISLLVVSVKLLKKLSWEELLYGGLLVAGLIAFLGAAITAMGHFSKFASAAQGVNMIAMSAAIAGMVLVMHGIVLITKKWSRNDFVKAGSLVAILMVTLVIMVNSMNEITPGGSFKIATTILSVVFAISKIAKVLTTLLKEPWDDIMLAAFSIVAVLAAIGGAIHFMEGLTFEAGALSLVLGVISYILIPALIEVSKMPVDGLLAFAGAFVFLMVSIAGGAVALSKGQALDGILGVLTALVAVSLTAISISIGLLLIATAVEKFAAMGTWDGVWKTIVVIGAVTAALTVLAFVLETTEFPKLIGSLVLAFIGLGAGLIIMIAALDALTELEISWESIGKLAVILVGLAGAIALLNLAGAPKLLNSIAIAIGVFIVAVGLLGAAIYFFQSDLVEKVPVFMATGVALILALGEGLIVALPSLIDTGLRVVLAFIYGLADAIMRNSKEVTGAFWKLGQTLLVILAQILDDIIYAIFKFDPEIAEQIARLGDTASGGMGRSFDLATPVEEELERTKEVMGGTRGAMEEEGGFLGSFANKGLLSEIGLTDIMNGELGDMLKLITGNTGDMFDANALLGEYGNLGFGSEFLPSDIADSEMLNMASAILNNTKPVEDATKRAAQLAVAAGKEVSAEPVGWNLVDGITSGVKARASSLARAASSVVTQAIGSANRTLDARSPSRVMMQSGRWFTEGFAIGIQQSSGMVDDNTTDMVESALDRVRSYAEELAQVLADDIEMRPKISPVLNLDGYDAEAIDKLLAAGQINGRLDFSDINAATDRRRISAPEENLQNANNLSIVNNIDMTDANFIIREDADIDKIAKALDERVVASMTKKGVRVVPV